MERLGNPERALALQRFFRTGPGQYGEGDVFRGITVPVLRDLARRHRDLHLEEAVQLLDSRFHEDRLLALFILIGHFKRVDEPKKAGIFDLYLGRINRINNWDLVDASAEHIPGAFLWDKDRAPLHALSHSKSLWERRIAVISTFHFIRRGDFADTLAISENLLADREDLIHKAVGWMLREVGKRSMDAEEAFLKKHCRTMPRTMLRYAIERFPEELRQAYLKAKVS
ncbi:MAG: DNA alkylation repair protein [Candidatus Fermentibacteraceae bacterium]